MGGLTLVRWPQQPVSFDGNGLALVLLALPAGTRRPSASPLARQALRQLLGELLARPPQTLCLGESASGPVLAGAECDIRISLSYASDYCLIGLARERRLGVDLVRIENLPEIDALSRLYLPAADCRAVGEALPGMRDATFALGWAQMEARSKCLGLPLAEIDRPREQALHECRLTACQQIADYRVALATRAL